MEVEVVKREARGVKDKQKEEGGAPAAAIVSQS